MKIAPKVFKRMEIAEILEWFHLNEVVSKYTQKYLAFTENTPKKY
jgi:hypothetical protein